LSEEDVITVPNLPFISGIPSVKALGFLGELGYRAIIASSKPKEFQNLTVAKYFHGYNDDFMNLVGKVKWDFNPEDVGILAPRRGMTKKSVTIFSGTGDYRDVGRTYALNDKTKLDIWKSDECNKVDGSDGIVYGPALVQSKKDVNVYLPNFCRSLPLAFDKELSIMDGMRCYRYKAPYGVFSSPKNNTEAKYFCELKTASEKQIDGVLDVSSCIDGNPPIFISHPHFYEGGPELFEHFEGLNPDQQLHESFAYIHPRLSVPLFGSSKMQINLKSHHFGQHFKNLPDGIILPLAWIETSTEEFPEEIKKRLYLSTVVVDFLETCFKFGSLLALVSSLVMFMLTLSLDIKQTAIFIRDYLKISS
jgi:scavenger receptor class B, member 1